MMDRSRLPRFALPVLAFAAIAVALRFATPAALRSSSQGQPRSSPSVSLRVPAALSSLPPRQGRGVASVRSTEGTVCPSFAPIAAYGWPRGFHYFPPNHPRRPDPSVGPDRCYRTTEEAEAEGFSTGLPPQGWDEVDGIFLAPAWEIGADLSRACERAADALGFPVPCAYTFPAPGEVSGPPTCGTGYPTNPRCVFRIEGAEAFFLQYRAFPEADGFLSGGAGLTVTAFPAAAASSGSEFELLFLCGGEKPSRSVTLTFPWSYQATPYRAALIECPEGAPPSGGQTLLRWKRAGVINVVGLPRRLVQDHEGVLERIAQGIQFVEPSR